MTLLRAFEEFVKAASWDRRRDIVERHPELLQPSAEPVLQALVRGQLTLLASKKMEFNRTLLRWYARVGPRRAVEILAQHDMPAELQYLLPRLPPEHRTSLLRIFAEYDTNESRLAALEAMQPLRAALETALTSVQQTRQAHMSSQFDAELNSIQNTIRQDGYGSQDDTIHSYERLFRQAEFAASPLDFQARVISEVAEAYQRRYDARHMLEDLRLSIYLLQRAAPLTPPESSVRAELMHDLASACQAAYRHAGGRTDLDDSIRWREQALFASRSAHQKALPFVLTSLSNSLLNRYDSAGKLADLENAILAADEAVTTLAADDPSLPLMMQNLANALRAKHYMTGDHAYLERSIEMYEGAASLTAPVMTSLPAYLTNNGSALMQRYTLTGERTDLDRAVEVLEQALLLTSPDAPAVLPELASTLGCALDALHEVTKDLADLHSAVSYHEEALDTIGHTSPDRPQYLGALGQILHKRFRVANATTDLERSIELLDEALSSSSQNDSSVVRQVASANLASSLVSYYGVSRDGDVLDRAITNLKTAVALSPPGYSELPRFAADLGSALLKRYSASQQPADIDAAIEACERAWLALQDNFASATVAYRVGQGSTVERVIEVVVDAYLLRTAASPEDAGLYRRRALVLVEAGKSRLLADIVGRRELPAPPSVDAEDAAREWQLLTRLTAIDTVALTQHGSVLDRRSQAERTRFLVERAAARHELDVLWQRMAGAGPGASNYVALRRNEPLTWDDIVTLANSISENTTFLSFFVGHQSTRAFIYRAGWDYPRVVSEGIGKADWVKILHNVVGCRHRRSDRRRDLSGERNSKTAEQQLRSALGPRILAFYERIGRDVTAADKLILSPHGPTHSLPWSILADVAGWACSGMDQASLSVVPAMTVLARLRRKGVPGGEGALVVGDPLGDLPHARDEAMKVATQLRTTALTGSTATKGAVLARLERASIVHLATHAAFREGRPLDSRILFFDGALTVQEVLTQRLNADLVVLSACETGMMKSLGGDEFVGLAQAFLVAGAQSLIVSLWPVDDRATEALMTSFYSDMIRGSDKARALGNAIAHVRSKTRWSDSYYWGAFLLVGDS